MLFWFLDIYRWISENLYCNWLKKRFLILFYLNILVSNFLKVIFVFVLQAMVMFVGAKSFKAELGACFSNLCKDPNIEVRKSVSLGFHEVMFETSNIS